MTRIKTIVFVSVLGFLLQSLDAYSFEIGTHGQLSDRAVRSSNVDSFLKTQLNFLYGIGDTLNGRPIIDIVQDGSRREDDPNRFCNHFHNPLRAWDQAGLQIPIPIVCPNRNNSSVLWGQSPSLQPTVGRFTWQDARQHFFQGLTALTKAERDSQLALTFRTLGQLIHLVQDAAVPAHTRNDPHLIFEGLESFAENTRTTNVSLFQQLAAGATRFDAAILELPPNPFAPIPIGRIIDTTDPEQATAVPSAGTNVGMAEYSNANFLSGDTIFKDFAFPHTGSLGIPFDGTDPDTGYPRRYFPKVADGETGFRLVATGTWTETLISIVAGDQGYILDDGVYEDYAGLLFPRAIGYSSGLLDYFFRGQLEIAPPDRFVYGRTSYREPFQAIDVNNNVNVFTRLAFKVRNATPTEDTSCPAGQPCAPPQLIAVVRYRTGRGADLIKAPETDPSDPLFFAVSQPLAVAPTATFQELTFDFSASPLPANVADVFLTVVYRGPLGLEADAIAVGGKDLFEPTPVDLANGTDYFCDNSELVHVSDFTTVPPFDRSHPDPITNPQPWRDPNLDGSPDIFGPHDDFGIYAKAAPFVVNPLSTGFDLPIPQTSERQYTRFFVLQDQPAFVLSQFINAFVEKGITPNIPGPSVLLANLYPANLNRIIEIGGSLFHQYRPAGRYRGVETPIGVIVVVPQDVASFLPCLGDSATKEDLIRFDSTIVGP